jgi:7-keto-8-aminopelargonate synthetase-like enzyme
MSCTANLGVGKNAFTMTGHVPPVLTQTSARSAIADGRSCVYYGGCDYLALAHDPRCVRAAIDALQRTGLGAGASRLTTGERPVYRQLEESLASFLRMEAAAILPSGSLSNLALVEALEMDVSTWLVDERAHPSFMSIIKRGDTPVKLYNHLDYEQFQSQLYQLAKIPRLGVFTDGLFPLTGDIAPLTKMFKALQRIRKNNIIVIDEAHSLGVLGQTGRGLLEFTNENLCEPTMEVILTGTLSKAIGAFGGYVAGSGERIRLLRSRAAAYRTSSPVPPFLAEVALANLGRLESETTLLTELRENIARMTTQLAPYGLLHQEPQVPIFSKECGSTDEAESLSNFFLSAGLIIQVVGGYASAGDRPSLRWSVNRAHTAQDLVEFGNVFGQALRQWV